MVRAEVLLVRSQLSDHSRTMRETYDLFGQKLTTAGNYTAEQPNKWGCKTFYYLTLVEVPTPKFELKVDPVCVDKEGVANIYQLHYTHDSEFAPISYSIRYDSVAQAMGFVDEEDIPIAPNQTTLSASGLLQCRHRL